MDAHIKIGKSILNKYAEYAQKQIIDDVAEYFPTIKVIIEGIVEAVDSSKEKEKLEEILVDHVKMIYVSSWIKNATDDEESPDTNYETKRAGSEFNKLFFNK